MRNSHPRTMRFVAIICVVAMYGEAAHRNPFRRFANWVKNKDSPTTTSDNAPATTSEKAKEDPPRYEEITPQSEYAEIDELKMSPPLDVQQKRAPVKRPQKAPLESVQQKGVSVEAPDNIYDLSTDTEAQRREKHGEPPAQEDTYDHVVVPVSIDQYGYGQLQKPEQKHELLGETYDTTTPNSAVVDEYGYNTTANLNKFSDDSNLYSEVITYPSSSGAAASDKKVRRKQSPGGDRKPMPASKPEEMVRRGRRLSASHDRASIMRAKDHHDDAKRFLRRHSFKNIDSAPSNPTKEAQRVIAAIGGQPAGGDRKPMPFPKPSPEPEEENSDYENVRRGDYENVRRGGRRLSASHDRASIMRAKDRHDEAKRFSRRHSLKNIDSAPSNATKEGGERPRMAVKAPAGLEAIIGRQQPKTADQNAIIQKPKKGGVQAPPGLEAIIGRQKK